MSKKAPDNYIVCAVCGKKVRVSPSQANRRKVCSSECAKMRKEMGFNRKERICKQCGKVEMVTVTRAKRPYCSLKCYADSMRLPEGAKRYRDPEKKRVKNSRTKVKMALRARGFDGDVGDLTPEQWKTILEIFDGRCAYCGEKIDELTIDHIIPASKGGRHTVDNVVPACRFYNQSKKDRIKKPKYLPEGYEDWLNGRVEETLK